MSQSLITTVLRSARVTYRKEKAKRLSPRARQRLSYGAYELLERQIGDKAWTNVTFDIVEYANRWSYVVRLLMYNYDQFAVYRRQYGEETLEYQPFVALASSDRLSA